MKLITSGSFLPLVSSIFVLILRSPLSPKIYDESAQIPRFIRLIFTGREIFDGEVLALTCLHSVTFAFDYIWTRTSLLSMISRVGGTIASANKRVFKSSLSIGFR